MELFDSYGNNRTAKSFLETEARSGSMDFGCVTPQYVYRMWGGTVAFEDIEDGLKQINLYDYR